MGQTNFSHEKYFRLNDEKNRLYMRPHASSIFNKKIYIDLTSHSPKFLMNCERPAIKMNGTFSDLIVLDLS